MNKTTNTNGIISQAASKSTVGTVQKTPSNTMRSILESNATKKLLEDSLKENAGAFSASILELYNSDSYLQTCDPKKVFKECFKAVSLKLPISKQLGLAYVIAYKGAPQFQLGYKGMMQLCLRSGKYRTINADVVYKGEYQGSDKLTGHIDLNGEKETDEVIGYFAYLETLDGFKKAVYWSKEQIIAHAKKYSPSFSYKNSPWNTNFDSMALKTVLKNLLSKYGIMSVEMENALKAEQPSENTEQGEDKTDIVIDIETPNSEPDETTADEKKAVNEE